MEAPASRQIILDLLHGDASVYLEEILVELILDVERNQFPVDFEVVQLVENCVFAVEEGFFRQDFFPRQIRAVVRHSVNKGFFALLEVDDFFEGPGEEAPLRFAHKPRVFRRGVLLFLEGPDEVGDAERKGLDDLLFRRDSVGVRLVKEGKIARRAVEEPREFDVVELVRDEAIVPRLLLREEVVRFQTFLHLQKRLQIFLGDFAVNVFKNRLAKAFVENLLIGKGYFFEFFFLKALDVLAVADVVVVPFDGVFEEVVVFFGKVFLDKAFEVGELFLVLLVDFDFRFGGEARAVGERAYFQDDLLFVVAKFLKDRREFVVPLRYAKGRERFVVGILEKIGRLDLLPRKELREGFAFEGTLVFVVVVDFSFRVRFELCDNFLFFFR